MICMAGLQVFIVRFFFQGARKGILEFSLSVFEIDANLQFRLCIIVYRAVIQRHPFPMV